jgi:hypothetical protein
MFSVSSPIVGYQQPMRVKPTRRYKMLSKTKVALSAAIILSVAFPASAATKHHRVIHAHPKIYNMVPDAGSCPLNGGPTCSNEGPALPDSW